MEGVVFAVLCDDFDIPVAVGLTRGEVDIGRVAGPQDVIAQDIFFPAVGGLRGDIDVFDGLITFVFELEVEVGGVGASEGWGAVETGTETEQS